ncbi:hypothetical protein Fmac_012111 [Flemingia macrophylla]|uniref:Dirigent protein n=1 Tax=Flemingia macrophylla TaxID=520843 RepID=A0ABD1MPC4_9FABA
MVIFYPRYSVGEMVEARRQSSVAWIICYSRHREMTHLTSSVPGRRLLINIVMDTYFLSHCKFQVPTMANHHFVVVVVGLLISCNARSSGEETGYVGPVDPNTVGLNRKQSLSHFRLFFHETFTPNNATSVAVVQPLPMYNATYFGVLAVSDNALTVGEDPNSKVVGRVEGFFAGTSQSEFDLMQILNFALSEGKYNGSSFVVLGRNRLSLSVRELPVVGGTGFFRFATGYAQVNTIFLDIQTRSTVEYNVYIYHY